MCGIFGWSIGREAQIAPDARRALARTLISTNARRGPHSWGAYCVTADGADVLRGVGSMARAEGVEARLADSRSVMGHSRWATVGEVTVENCHPFTIAGITVAHNGGIFNHADLAAKYGRTCSVDSQHIAHHLATGLPFTDMQGYGAIEYVRAGEPAAIHLCRMSGGELSAYGLGTREAPQGVVWSSDATHLRAAIYDAKLDAFPYEKMREGRVYLADGDGVLYVLPAEVSHVLGKDSMDEREKRRRMAVTSGKTKDAAPPSRSVSIESGPTLKPGQWRLFDPYEEEAKSDREAVERMMDEEAKGWLELLARAGD